MRARGPALISLVVAIGAFSASSATAATISVDILTDTVNSGDGDCSLREAVTSSEANSDINDCADGEAGAVDVISLDSTGDYALTGGSGDDANLSGDLDFGAGDAGVTIEGDPGFLGFPADHIDGGNNDRVLDFLNVAMAASLDGVQIQNGQAPAGQNGGGIRATNGTALTVTGFSILQDNETPQSGGAISREGVGPGAPVMNISTTLVGFGGGGNTAKFGGGISTNGPLVLDNSVVGGNTATEAADGAAESIGGGGISVSTNTGEVSITDTAITGNHVVGTEAQNTVNGGGVVATGAAPMTLNGVTISDNDLSGGTPGFGAGVWVPISGGNVTSLNSTISGNSFAAGGFGGGVSISTGGASATLVHTTVADNVAASGPGIGWPAGATLTLRGTIIDQGPTGCDALGTLVADAYNLSADSSCVGAAPDSDLIDATPDLLPLASAGGPSQTHPLAPASSAIDAVPVASCKQLNGTSDLLVDQRGAERPFDAACDIGSYERVTCNGMVPTILGGPDNDTLNGSAGANVIVGSAGDDTIDGAGAADAICGGSDGDHLNGGAGGNDDFLDGGLGNDTAEFPDNGGDSVEATLPAGPVAGVGDPGNDTIFGFENLSGTSGADTLTGDGGANVLFGSLGPDTITGGGASDQLLAGPGADNIFARDGVADTVDCGADADVDSAQLDVQGTDTLLNCIAPDLLDFLPAPVTAPPPTPTPPATKKCPKGKKLRTVKTKSGKKKKKCVRKKRRKK